MKLKKIISFLIPTSSVTPLSSEHEPISMAALNRISAANVAMALRAAEYGDTRDLFTLYRDNILTWSHLQAEFAKRKIPVLSKPISVSAYVQGKLDDDATADDCSTLWEPVKNRISVLSHLLDSILFPVSVVEKVYSVRDGRYVLDRLIPVPHHLLDYQSGVLRIRMTKPSGEQTDECVEPDPSRYIIHRAHILSAPDKLGGPMRALVYWWLFSTQSRDWWIRFLQRYGIPLMIGKYTHGADDQRTALLRAMSTVNRALGLVISKDTSLEFAEVARLDAMPFTAVQEFANHEASKLILGQTLSAESQPTGIGSGNADLHGEVRSDIALFDCANLAESLRDQLYTQYCEINALPGNVPLITIGSPVDPGPLLSLLKALKESGLRPAESSIQTISRQVGFDVERDIQPAASSPFAGF